jgi:hypothetical protein
MARGEYRSVPLRRFPPPWIVEEHNDACLIVRGAAEQAPSATPHIL